MVGMQPCPLLKQEKDVPKPSPPSNSLQWDSSPAYHPPAAPNGDGSKDRGGTRVPYAQGVAAKASAVGFCLGCGLFGSYNSL